MPSRLPGRWKVAALATTGLLVAGAIALGTGSRAEKGASSVGAPAGRGRLLVADLENHTRDSLLAGAIGEALRVQIAQSPRIAVLSSQQVRAALGRMHRVGTRTVNDSLARELAVREGIGAYVTGAIRAAGGGFRVSAELVSAEEGEVVAAVTEHPADSTALLQAVDRAGSALRRRLGDSAVAGPTALPLEQITTRSLEALRSYAEAVRFAEREDNERRAYGLLRQAVARDTGFAIAWRKLAVVSANVGEIGTALLASDRAFQHRDRLPVRDRYLVMAQRYTAGDQPQEAIGAYAALLELYPDDAQALFNTGLVFAQQRDFHRAEEYRRRALAADTTVPMFHWSLALDLLNQGRLDAAADQAREALRRFPGLERALWLEVDIAIARGDPASAERRTRELLAAAPGDYRRRNRGLRTLATLALMQGRVDEAERHLRALEPVLRREGTGGERVDLAATLAFVEAWYRRSGARGVELMERFLADVKLDTVRLADRHNGWRGYVYALGGRPSRALALTAEARKGASEGIGREAELLRTDGVARLAQNRVRDAVTLLRRSVDGDFCPVCGLPDLARAYERAGEPDSAIALYQRYVDTPWSERWSANGEFQGHALLRLGELREQRGDRPGALSAYRRFIQLWHAADPELAPLVVRARERMLALERDLDSRTS